MEMRPPRGRSVPQDEDATAELNHGTPQQVVMLQGGSEVSSHRHRTAIEQYDASACLVPPIHAVGTCSTGNPEAAAQAFHGRQLAIEEAVGCASAAHSRSASGPSHVAQSAPDAVNLCLEKEDSTAGDATPTSVFAASTQEPPLPQTSSSRDALGGNKWGPSSVSSNAVVVGPQMSVASSPYHGSQVCHLNNPPSGVLTHIVGEYIIQESSEPFPVDYKSPLVGLVSQILFLDKDDNPDTDIVADSVAMGASSSAHDELPQYESPPSSPARTTPMETETRTSELEETSGNKNPRTWTIQEVSDCIRNIPGCEKYADVFSLHLIDGAALFLLSREDILTIMKIQLGPALKIWDKIKMLREQE